MASGLFSSIQSLSTKLIEAIRGTTSPDIDRNESVREDLEKLSRMLSRIQAVQQDAEEREIHDCSVRLWLAELTGVAYQAEDVLDEFYYEVLRSIVESGDAAIEAYHRDEALCEKRRHGSLVRSLCSRLALSPFLSSQLRYQGKFFSNDFYWIRSAPCSQRHCLSDLRSLISDLLSLPMSTIRVITEISSQSRIYTPIGGCTVTVFTKFSHHFLTVVVYCLLPLARKGETSDRIIHSFQSLI